MIKKETIEKKCKIHGLTTHIQYDARENRSSTCKKCASERVINSRRRKKKRLVEKFGGKCQKCGYKKFLGALQFHHIDPKTKLFSISQASKGYEACLIEAQKCALLCANCHAEHHNMIKNNKISILKPAKMLKDCIICGDSLKNKQKKYCSLECSSFATRKVIRPLKKVLMVEIKNNSWCKLGKKYNVSDNTVKKWAKRYKLI